MVVGDDVAGSVPYEAGAGLLAAALLLPLQERLPARPRLREDVDDRWRGALEELDVCPLERREIAAGGDRARRLLGVEQPRHIGLGDESREEQDGEKERDARGAVPHGCPPGCRALPEWWRANARNAIGFITAPARAGSPARCRW